MKKRTRPFPGLLWAIILALMLLVTGCYHGGDEDTQVNVTLLQTTDLHNTVSGVGDFNAYTPMDTSDHDAVLGGWARMAAKIREIRAAGISRGRTVLLIDSGDFTMGTTYDMLWNSNPAPFQFLKEMNYDIITLGNHEFDYGPAKLATMIDQARTGGFNIPIVATNTVFDGIGGTDDDDLETLQAAGVIITDTYVKTYANGLKIGVIGLMGQTANDYSPNAPPVTFRSDYTNDAVKAFIQQKVDALRSTEHVHVVIALSHSGITSPNTSPAGDDVRLAQNITGIDIIASGHEHETTHAVVPVANGSHTSYIVCAGAYGTNLAQLDFTVNLTTRRLAGAPVLTNHAINDTIAGDDVVNSLVQVMNASISTLIAGLGVTPSTVTATSLLTLGDPGSVREFGLGNLLADAVRYAGTESGVPTIGLFSNGVIRNGFAQNQAIAFADLFAAAPLGMTTDNTQSPLFPGYPLLKVYLTGDEIWDMCRFDATIMAYPSFIAYFSSLAGLKYTYTGTTINSVEACAWNDYTCTGATTPIPRGATLYPVVIDKYVMDMLLSDSVQGLLSAISISLHPKLAGGTVIDRSNMMDARIDRDLATPGVQEYYGWSAALKFFTEAGGLNGTIPVVPYNLSVPRMIAQ